MRLCIKSRGFDWGYGSEQGAVVQVGCFRTQRHVGIARAGAFGSGPRVKVGKLLRLCLGGLRLGKGKEER
jgi:hypothetical protein